MINKKIVLPNYLNLTIQKMTDLVKYPFTYKNENFITEILSENKVLAFPTETVYGLGGNAFSKEVADRIYLIKQRPRNKPFPLLITLKWLKKLCHWNDSRIDDLIEAFWPGPLTLILNSNPDFFQSMIFENFSI